MGWQSLNKRANRGGIFAKLPSALMLNLGHQSLAIAT
jgi:hypothetical protein